MSKINLIHEVANIYQASPAIIAEVCHMVEIKGYLTPEENLQLKAIGINIIPKIVAVTGFSEKETKAKILSKEISGSIFEKALFGNV